MTDKKDLPKGKRSTAKKSGGGFSSKKGKTEGITAKKREQGAPRAKESDPTERINLKPGVLLSPLPAVMVTVGDIKNANIITIGWCGVLSTDPPRVYISVRPSRHSFKLLEERGEFVINLTTEALAKATDYAGIYTGAKVDKFEKLGLTAIKSENVACPTIAEAPLSLECRVFSVTPSGTHHIFMADVVGMNCAPTLKDKDGRLRLDKAGLIAYAHGEYFAIGRSLGKFGFSTAKKKTKRKG